MFRELSLWTMISEKQWTSKVASRLFGATSLYIIFATPFWYWIIKSPVPPSHSSAQEILNIYGALYALCMAVIWTSMWHYWRQCDTSKRSIKRMWLFMLIFCAWFGAVAYYFVIYLPQARSHRTSALQDELR